LVAQIALCFDARATPAVAPVVRARTELVTVASPVPVLVGVARLYVLRP
jgi:hypothetical protein